MRCFHRGMTVWRDNCFEIVSCLKLCSTHGKIKKTYSTWDSLVVPYQSTDQAQRCLTSQFGWDAVLSPWYDRMTRLLFRNRIPSETLQHKLKNKDPGREIWTPDQWMAALAHFTVHCSTAELPPDGQLTWAGIRTSHYPRGRNGVMTIFLFEYRIIFFYV